MYMSKTTLVVYTFETLIIFHLRYVSETNTKYYKNYNRFKLNGFLVFITKKFRKIALLRSNDKFKKKISHINFI